ncbi:MAG: NifB/NifX family molybdenum-iron cluster-binding protein [Deltaproteobacteria bacterium]|nr:NifB/NifX family molybdenum-iron cluster-binding protein [Deltaproteobacteria bacterium]
MRLAIPIWENKVSPLLDTASKFLIIEVDKRKEISRYITPVVKQDLSERCQQLKENGVDILICGALSRKLANMIITSGIIVFPEISGAVDEIIRAYSKGTLLSPKFSLPGHGRKGE